MAVRAAKIKDVGDIHSLITYYAEFERMLFRSKAEIYEKIQSFIVAESDGRVMGCCCLSVVWADLAEVKSLAVEKNFAGKGVGRELVSFAEEKARELGIERVFALTLEPGFFDRLGYKKVDRSALPMKVWSDCAKCPKQDSCDEIAVVKEIC